MRHHEGPPRVDQTARLATEARLPRQQVAEIKLFVEKYFTGLAGESLGVSIDKVIWMGDINQVHKAAYPTESWELLAKNNLSNRLPVQALAALSGDPTMTDQGQGQGQGSGQHQHERDQH